MMAIFTFFALFGGNYDPTYSTLMALLVYILPLLIIGNAVVLVFWLIRRRWHWAAIPAVTILFCIPYIGTLYQPGWFSSSDESKAGIKIASYNVAMFGRELTGFKAEDILSEMKRQKVDIFCIQEYMEVNGGKNNTESYKDYFGYYAKGRSDMMIFSRYPIKQSKTTEFDQTNNSTMWADIDVNGKVFRVFNVHLETTGINRSLHQAAKLRAKGSNIEDNAIIKAIYGKYTLGMIARAGQSRMVAQEIHESEYPVIVCGDFNDVPYSYTYNIVKGDLVDGFKECGKGYMSTFKGGNKKVRIDYIFHDESLTGENYYKLDLSYSDHDPVLMKIALK